MARTGASGSRMMRSNTARASGAPSSLRLRSAGGGGPKSRGRFMNSPFVQCSVYLWPKPVLRIVTIATLCSVIGSKIVGVWTYGGRNGSDGGNLTRGLAVVHKGLKDDGSVE